MFSFGTLFAASPFLDFVTHDWWIALPMFGMSISAITLVIWRLLLNSRAATDMNVFLPLFQDRLEKEGVEGALKFCKSREDFIPKRLFSAGLESSKQGTAAMRRSMANAVELEIVPDLNFLLPSMLAIAKIATMVGLLGTVISMTATFAKIGEAVKKGGAASESSGEIGLALFATALGLVTAIPLVFAHVLLKAWIGKFEIKMKSGVHKFLILMQNLPATPPKPAAPAKDKDKDKDAKPAAPTSVRPAEGAAARR
jgi:biopolymer transport protein ExbB